VLPVGKLVETTVPEFTTALEGNLVGLMEKEYTMVPAGSATGRQIGRINGDRIYDGSGRQIGRADGMRRRQIIVFFYFFM